jgi:hypothetical protein
MSITNRSPGAHPTQNYDDARADLPSELQPIFDDLCQDVIAWSNYFYGRKLISYSILKELVATGWKKQS